MNYIIFIACISSVLLFVFYVLCIFILHIRIDKLEELQKKTANLLLEIEEDIEILKKCDNYKCTGKNVPRGFIRGIDGRLIDTRTYKDVNSKLNVNEV